MSQDESRQSQIVNNTILLMVARVSMALSLPALGMVASLGYAYLDNRFSNIEDRQSSQQSQISASNTDILDLRVTDGNYRDRLTSLEVTQRQESREMRAFQDAVLEKMDRFQDSILRMSTNLAALSTVINGGSDIRRNYSPLYGRPSNTTESIEDGTESR